MASLVINTRADLDAIAGTPEHAEFMQKLRGSLVRQQDAQTYPEDYNAPDYQGPKLPPVWQSVEDLSVISAFGFSKSEVLGAP